VSQSASPIPDISVLDYSGDKPQARYLGIPAGAWAQILIIAALMAALFRFNLVRLWGKTNPIDGQDTNWQHSMFVPLIGLWYLFIHREELVAAAREPVRREKSIQTLASLGLGAMALACAYLTSAGSGWMFGIVAFTFVALLPAFLLRLIGADFGPWPERVRWIGRIGVMALLVLLVCFGPALNFAAPAMHFLEAAVLLPSLLAVALWLPLLVPTSTVLGAVSIFAGLLTFAAAIYPIQNDYAKDLGMVITLFGVVALLGGWAVMRIAWFPIAFLVVALPWPELVYQKLAWPLQKLAASASVGTLRIFAVEARRDETMIWFMVPTKGGAWEWESLSVAEACAGLRSLMTFLMVAGTVAFLQRRKLWEKLFITFSAIPIAIFCNMVRVSGQGLLHRYVSKETSVGFAHSFVGLLMLIPGFFLILLVQWLLEKLFIEEAEGSRKAAASSRKIVAVPKKKTSDPAGGAESPAGVAETISAAVTQLGRSPAIAATRQGAGASAPAAMNSQAPLTGSNPARPPAARTAAPAPVSAPVRPAAAPVTGGAKPIQPAAAPSAGIPAAKPPARPAAVPVNAARPATTPPPGSIPGPAAKPAVPPRAAATPAGAVPPTGVTPPRPAAAKPPSAPGVPASGLLASPVRRPISAPGTPGASTLKPSSRPPAAAPGAVPVARPVQRPVAAPGAGPVAPRPAAGAPQPGTAKTPVNPAQAAPGAVRRPMNVKPPVDPNTAKPDSGNAGTGPAPRA